MSPGTADLAAAYTVCERITAVQARNFSWGIRLLPAPRRRALSAVYALARRIDDIGDSTAPAQDRERGLLAVRADVAAIRGGDPTGAHAEDPVLLAVADAAAVFALPLEEFEILVDGCLADVHGTRYATFEDLGGYCRQVAGSIGRLSVAVFGAGNSSPAGPVEPLADALGTALQLTNIIRDVREDARDGRVYLPVEDLHRFGCTLALDGAGELADDPDDLTALVEYEAARAAEWFDVGLRLLPLLDRRSRACCAAMAGIYRELLSLMVRRPRAVLSGRSAVSDRRKVVVAVGSLATSWRRPLRAVPSTGSSA